MLKNKNVLRLLSLVLALFLWFYVVAVENPLSERRISKVPIQFVNHGDLEKRGLAIDYSDVQTMDVVVSGARSDVMKVSAEDVVATADLTGATKGKEYVSVSVKLPRKVELVEQRTQSILVNVENLKTVKKEAAVRFTGNFAKNKEPKLFSQDLTEVTVIGAKSQVAKVYKVFADLNASKLRESATKHSLAIAAYDASGKEVGGVKFSAKKLNVEAGLYSIKEVPLSLDLKGEPPAEYRISSLDYPKTVEIAGFSSALEGVEKLVSDPIYLNDLQESKKLAMTISLPEGVELLEPEEVNLEVKIRGLDSKEFLVSSSSITIKGLDAGRGIVLDSEPIKVKAVAKDDDSTSISANDVNLYIDLAGLDVGEHTVKVRVEQADNVGDVSVEPQEITVKIE